MRTLVHLHLPRAKAGNPAMLSVKTGQQPMQYAEAITLRDCKFLVQPAGRAKTLATGQKTVHAFVSGVEWGPEWRDFTPDAEYLSTWRKARYNPREHETFVDAETGKPIFQAFLVHMVGKTVYYIR